MFGYSRVLVTGGAGFIGSHIVDRLLAEDVEVIVLDSMHSGRLENIEKHLKQSNFRFVKGDVRDVGLVRDLFKGIDAVFHLAALVSVPGSIENPVLTNDVNVNGTLNLLVASADSEVKRFVYASSSAVYGETKTVPIDEEFPTKPLSPYGASKLAAESYVKSFNEVFGLRTVCLRYFNVYGPRQGWSDYSSVITQFIKRFVNDCPPVIFGDGRQTRDFVSVADVVEANMLALTEKGVVGETFNVATGKSTTINHLAELIAQIVGKTYEGKHEKPREGDIKHSVADISKATRELKYVPKMTLQKGLEDTIAQQMNCGQSGE
jgi:UDP-glucose 4-epimerase